VNSRQDFEISGVQRLGTMSLPVGNHDPLRETFVATATPVTADSAIRQISSRYLVWSDRTATITNGMFRTNLSTCLDDSDGMEKAGQV
jgi:hypothetical protein